MESLNSRLGLELTIATPGMRPICVYGESIVDCVNMRNFDMNKPACGLEEEFSFCSTEDGEDVEDEGSKCKSKKLQLSKEQCKLLEESFRHNQTLNHKQKEELASKLKLRPRQVEVWFQNHRARTKLKQTEMECRYLRRCFTFLREENQKLRLEVEKLRAVQASPPTVILPDTNKPIYASELSLCPRCQCFTAFTSNGRKDGSKN